MDEGEDLSVGEAAVIGWRGKRFSREGSGSGMGRGVTVTVTVT